MLNYLYMTGIVALIFSARRTIYYLKNRRGNKTIKARLISDIAVVSGCLILLNPILFRYVVISANIEANLVAVIYATLVTVWFIMAGVFVQKELQSTGGVLINVNNRDSLKF